MTGIGERFKAARLSAGMSQEEVGHRACVRRATVSDIERGVILKVRPETIEALCKVLGADMDYIVNGWRCADNLGITDVDHLSQLGRLDRIEYKLDLLLARTKHLG